MITESVDASARITPPVSGEANFGDDLRWKAGPLLGGLDWLLEQLTGCSPIETMVKPLSGDWVALDNGRIAWLNCAALADDVSLNFTDLASQTSAEWAGNGSAAFQNRAISIGDTFTQYGDGCRAMGEAMEGLISLAKATAETIVTILGILGDALTRIAAQAAVPVIGWITGAVDGGITAIRMVGWIDKAIKAIQAVINFIGRFAMIIAILARVAAAIATIAKTAAARINVSTANAVDDATATAFGVTA